MKLMLHCGGKVASREEVYAAPVPPETTSYMPLSHEALVTRIEKQLMVEGMKVKSEQLALAKDGARLFGLFHIEMPGMNGGDFGSIIGFRNSYDRSCSIGMAIGASVFVCDNLSFHGDQVTLERKHTKGLLKDLSWLLTENIAKLPQRFIAQSKTFEDYKRVEITDKMAHDLVIRFMDEGAINVTDIRPLVQEFREPRHPEFSKDGKTAWRLFNAATEVMKGDIWRLPARTRKIHDILDVECGLVTPPAPGIIPVTEWMEHEAVAQN